MIADLVMTVGVVLACAGTLACWTEGVTLAWRWLSFRIWWLSYPIDGWVERRLNVPDELRRFS